MTAAAFYNVSNSFSDMTLMPFCSNSAVVTPVPGIFLPLKVPS